MVNTVREKSRVSLELLSLFATVVEQGSISAAARQWNISPSLATRKVGLLEAELSAHLLDRTTRRVHVTEAGKKVYAWATEVVTGHAALFDELATAQKKVSGTLRIISNEYLLSVVLPEFLAGFSARYPEIGFALTMTDSVVPAEKRDYDVAIFSGQVPDTLLKGIAPRPLTSDAKASPRTFNRWPCTTVCCMTRRSMTHGPSSKTGGSFSRRSMPLHTAAAISR
jgi:LysR family transcriptional activator of dmlA